MGQETERKYLVVSDAWRQAAHKQLRIRQGYLSMEPERAVRIRTLGEAAYFTVKGATSGITRPEFEYPIPVEDAHQLLELCVKPLIEKTRHYIERDGLTWEVDEFSGENAGLVVAEAETESEEPLTNLPEWVGEEVSHDFRYQNLSLVTHPFSKWRTESAKLETKFQFKKHESIRKGLRRIVNEELSAALQELSSPALSIDEAVHDARKSLKKVRAILRLLRPVFGGAYRRENRELRGLGRRLSEVRDGQAMIEILDHLNEEYPESEGYPSLADARTYLIDRKDQIDRKFQASGDLEQVQDELRHALERADSWTYEDAGIELLSQGIMKVIRRGRNAADTAYADPRPEYFHEWRKRAKDLRYQLELVRKAWPDVLDGYLASVKELEEKLGNDHNLAVLSDIIQRDQDRLEAEAKRELLARIDTYQQRLRAESKVLGERIYGDKPKRWARLLESSWSAWRKENGGADKEQENAELTV